MTVAGTKELSELRTLLHQLLKYGLVGIVLNVFWYSIYLLSTYIGGEPKAVMTVLYVGATISSYWFNRTITFSHNGRKSRSLFRFAFTYSIGYLINLAGLYIGFDLLRYPHQLVQAALIFIVAGVLFLLQKYWVFKEDYK